MSMGHFLDLNAQALGLFRLPLALAAASLFLCPLASLILRKRAQPHAANLALAAGAFGFLLAAHLGLQTFAPVLSSAQLAEAIAPLVHPDDLIVIHQEYEYGSTLGFYLQRPRYDFAGLLARSAEIPELSPANRTDGRRARQPPPSSRRHQPDPHPHRRQLQRHRQLRPQLQPLVRQLLPRRAAHLRNHTIARPKVGRPAAHLPLAGPRQPAQPAARCALARLRDREVRRQGDRQQ